MVITPTVGRVVWYYGAGKSQIESGVQPEAALVAHVHGDRKVNLGGFTSHGHPFARTSVTLVQEGDEIPQHECCTWMPYQLNAAKQATK